MNKYLLEIVSPERLAYSEEVEQVSVPSEDGELTILPNHASLFANLVEGELAIRKNAEDHYLAIGGGFLEVTRTKVMVLVSRAAHARELNEKAILDAQKQAKEAIKKGATGEDLRAAQALLRSSLIDLRVVRRMRKGRRPVRN